MSVLRWPAGMSRRGVGRCALAAVLFGASTPAASPLAEDLGPLSLAGLLYLGAALAVLPFAGAGRPGRAELATGARRLAVAVVAGGAVAPVLFALGLDRAPAATVSLLLNLELVFTALLAVAVFHEHLGRPLAAGTGLVVVAGVLLTWSDGGAFRWGALFVVGACACWAVDNSVTAGLDALAPVHITLAKGLVAGSVNLALGVAVVGAPPAGPALAALAVGGLGYGASITLWIAGARELGAARGQLVFAAAPFVGALLAWTVLGEPATAAQVAALVLAGTGVATVLASSHEHRHGHDERDHDHEHGHDDGHHAHHPGPVAGRHRHLHHHTAGVHAHPHVPDVHHRHPHGDGPATG